MTISEATRLAELASYEILDTAAEQAYDDITYLAAQICETPIALVSLVDFDRQWFKSKVGLEADQTPRDMAFCHHAIQTPTELMTVNDAASDERFAQNPLVTQDPNIRFYAGAPLVTATGNALGTLCVIDRVPREISEEQQNSLMALSRMVMAQMNLRIARDAAEAADRAKMRFLSGMSHEIRTPLNAIMGLSELMSTEAYGPLGNPKYAEYMGDIHAAGDHLRSLISDILDWSRIAADRVDLADDVVYLSGIVEDSIQILSHQASEKDVKIETRVNGDLPAVLADSRRLRQVLINLVTNSVKFTEAGGHVIVEAGETDDGSMFIDVIDDGIGMSEDEVTMALTPFGQAQTTAQQEGTGLGLPISSRLVDAHGGELTLESTPGVGTTARVRLPASRIIREFEIGN